MSVGQEVETTAASATAALLPEEATPTLKLPPLLREGTVVSGARGHLRHEEKNDWWWLVADSNDPEVAPLEMVLLPNGRLEAMRQSFAAAEDPEGLFFEVTGQVFLYRNRNFLLVTHAPPLQEEALPAEPETAPRSSTGDTVEDIMRELEQAVGPVPVRAPAQVAEPLQGGAPEGVAVLARRGKLSRSHAGTWIFVLDADAQGLSDPPLTVLPCQLLERMERYAGRAGRTAPLLISGRLYTYQNRRYLLPTVFNVPHERTVLTP